MALGPRNARDPGVRPPTCSSVWSQLSPAPHLSGGAGSGLGPFVQQKRLWRGPDSASRGFGGCAEARLYFPALQRCQGVCCPHCAADPPGEGSSWRRGETLRWAQAPSWDFPASPWPSRGPPRVSSHETPALCVKGGLSGDPKPGPARPGCPAGASVGPLSTSSGAWEGLRGASAAGDVAPLCLLFPVPQVGLHQCGQEGEAPVQPSEGPLFGTGHHRRDRSSESPSPSSLSCHGSPRGTSGLPASRVEGCPMRPCGEALRGRGATQAGRGLQRGCAHKEPFPASPGASAAVLEAQLCLCRLPRGGEGRRFLCRAAPAQPRCLLIARRCLLSSGGREALPATSLFAAAPCVSFPDPSPAC